MFVVDILRCVLRDVLILIAYTAVMRYIVESRTPPKPRFHTELERYFDEKAYKNLRWVSKLRWRCDDLKRIFENAIRLFAPDEHIVIHFDWDDESVNAHVRGETVERDCGNFRMYHIHIYMGVLRHFTDTEVLQIFLHELAHAVCGDCERCTSNNMLRWFEELRADFYSAVWMKRFAKSNKCALSRLYYFSESFGLYAVMNDHPDINLRWLMWRLVNWLA